MAWTKIKMAAVVGGIALLTIGTGTLLLPTRANSAEQTDTKKVPISYDSPEATVKALIAALKTADHEQFAAACTPERAEIFRTQNAGKSEEQLKREALGMAKALASYKILEKKEVSATEVILRIKATGDLSEAQPGDLAGLNVRLRKIGNDWKFDGHVR